MVPNSRDLSVNLQTADHETGSSRGSVGPVLRGHSDLFELQQTALRDSAAVVDHAPVRSPVTFSGCFGWLHTPSRGAGSDIAVLLCTGLVRDALDCHHSYRVLADELAYAGYPTMRFDFPGTGDSCDLDGKECWTAWLQGVNAAADWLRDATGAQRVLLCGIRIGATLAALVAAARGDVAGLVLLAPVLRGSSYLRQLQVEAQLRGNPSGNGRDNLEFHELEFGSESIREIKNTDLRTVALMPGLQVIIFAQNDSQLLSECIAAWHRLGVAVRCQGFDGLEPMLRHNMQGEGLPADVSAIIAWVRQAVSARVVPLAAPRLPTAPRLETADCVEIPLRFGAERRLFGVLCTPKGRVADKAVVIGNTGRDPHYGSARFGVEFARRLAAAGLASLRIDFAGLGDSIGHPGKENILSPIFEGNRTPDISAAIDLLGTFGYTHIAVHGVCAGAYHALHAALADPRIETLLLVNLPAFSWRDGDTVDFVARKTSNPRRYLAMLTRREQWRLLLQAKFDLADIVRAQCARTYERAWETMAAVMERLGVTGPRGVARRAMATLARRGARTLFLNAEDDLAIEVLERNFGRRAVGLSRFEGASMKIIPELDHMLSGRQMRQTVAGHMIDFLATPPSSSLGGAARLPNGEAGQQHRPR